MTDTTKPTGDTIDRDIDLHPAADYGELFALKTVLSELTPTETTAAEPKETSDAS